MKLVLINRYFYPDESATSRMVTSLAWALRRKGWSVRVVASRCLHNDTRVRLPADETVCGVAVHRVPTTVFGRGNLLGRAFDYATFHLATVWHLFGTLRAGDVCVVCTDPPLLSISALLPVVVRGGILVNWLLDLFPEVALVLGVGMRRSMGIALRLRDLSLKRARLNVAPMKSMADYLTERGIPAATVRVVDHWSDGDAVRPLDRERNALRREWGLTDRFVVGYSGNFGRAHDFTTFLGAAARLRDRREIVFVFVGDGHQQAAIERTISDMRLDNVLLKPLQPRERLAETLGVADLHLISLAPDMEPFVIPSKLYGILAAGRPAAFVGDLDGEIARVLKAGKCGFSVAPGDSAGLAEKIVDVLNDPNRAARMGAGARKLFDACFTEKAGTGAWERLLEEALPATRASPAGAEPRGLFPREAGHE